jgi:hypothetical protein
MILKLLKRFLPKTMSQHELSSWYLGWTEGYQEGLLDQLEEHIYPKKKGRGTFISRLGMLQ